MDPGVRTALLIGGLIFVVAFVGMTLTVAFEYGFDILSFSALVIALMLAAPLIGALIRGPEE